MSKIFVHFVGMDVAKATLDVALIKDGCKENTYSFQVSNSISGMKDLFKWLCSHHIDLEQTLFCMEHTGLYGKLPTIFISSKTDNLWIEMSLKILRSQGIKRGKTDKLDAIRIAMYALKNVDDAQLFVPVRPELDKIKILMGTRNRLINAKKSLEDAAKENIVFSKDAAKEALGFVKKSITGITKDLVNIENELKAIVENDQQLKQLFNVVTSVPGIGKITALFLICFTNEFKSYHTGKQLACYCGVAPFEHSSGTSIRGKTRVNHMANKILKKQLHMGALSAITHNQELKAYYERKIAEGKHKMLVINNVRNKIALRVCAVVNRMEPYKIAA